ncbi:MAG: alpha/beta fold hydrolase [Rhodospirillaceae bacterium]|nr:alpha/beta fold hydrolase [Rhodospirillaceae bacterium]MBT6139954.1 alpha/beta fold hydrolase [Rhodospirillaceae bacterium]
MTFLPWLNDVSGRARRIETPCDDGSMVWRVWGEGEPLVLLHGGFGSWMHWCRNVLPLSQHYQVIAADIPGLGESDLPDPPHDADRLAGIISNGLSEIVGKTGRCHIVGFSFGSMLGSVVASGLEDRLSSLTLVGVAGMGPRERGPTAGMVRVHPEMDADEHDRAIRTNLEILMLADPANVDDLAMHIQSDNTKRSRIRSRPLSLSDRTLVELERVWGPVGAIWGGHDRTCWGVIEERKQEIMDAAPSADIRVLDGVGHWVQYEDAEGFNAELLDLLADARGRPSGR